MPRSLGSPHHEALRLFLIKKRKEAGLTQAELAEELQMHQPHISLIERGQRRVDVVEFLRLAKILQFDPAEAIRAIDAK